MIFDFHTHAYPLSIAKRGTRAIEDFYAFNEGNGVIGSIEELNEQCEKAGVTHKLLLAVATRPNNVESINNWVSQQLDENTFGFGSLHPNSEDPIKELERFSEIGLTGVKFHPDMQQFNIDDEHMFKVYEWCEGRLPIYFHSGDNRYDFSAIDRLCKVLDRFPKLVVVAAHFGGYTKWQESLDKLCGRENLYFDTSSTLRFTTSSLVEKIIKKHGSDKIMFGTDFPIMTAKKELEYFNKLEINEDDRQRILHTNAMKFFAKI